MGGFYVHGPTLTYVTDPTLSISAQQHVIAEFVGNAEDQMLRVAFRLPHAADDDIERLLTDYLRVIDGLGVARRLLPPLIHHRPHLVARFDGTGLWMPARAIAASIPAAAYSVHTVREARDAIAAGAAEVICGHIFATGSHPGEPGRGISLVKDIANVVRTDVNTPVVTAFGGVHEHVADQIGRARIFNVACMRAISHSPNIARTLATIRQNWITALIDEDLNDPEPLAFDRMWGIWHRWEADSRV